jgi:tRNA threonylcarbamoyladenosine biosynthesis protein TsaE
MKSVSILIKNFEQTQELAGILSSQLKRGDMLILKGNLAIGKTYFVKALVEALGTNDIVTSPTYAIANFYKIKDGKFLHIDAYRISSIHEFRDLGLEELFPESITAIEWGEKLISDFSEYLLIEFAPVDLESSELESNTRTLTFSGVGERWESLPSSLENSPKNSLKNSLKIANSGS